MKYIYLMSKTGKGLIRLRTKQKQESTAVAVLSWYPRSESNRDQRNRNPLFYPLNYRGVP